MNGRQTILNERLAAAFPHFAGRPGIGFRSEDEVRALVVEELGALDALDRPVRAAGGWRQAVAPRLIYHVLASNLAVSAEASLLLGLVLGSRLVFKLPSAGLGGFDELAARAGRAADVRLTSVHEPESLAAADAVVVFGSDETVSTLRAEVRGTARFLAYGHKFSLGILPPGCAGEAEAAQAARELAAFGQGGCLSPQAYLCADAEEAARFGPRLAAALAHETGVAWKGDAASRRDARLRAWARGDVLHEPRGPEGPVVVVRGDGQVEPGPGGGWVDVCAAPDLQTTLGTWRGKLSAWSVAGPVIPADVWRAAAALGVSRLCPMGALQDPPWNWRHDGRPRLGDLVTWVACDPGMNPAEC